MKTFGYFIWIIILNVVFSALIFFAGFVGIVLAALWNIYVLWMAAKSFAREYK